MTPRDRAWWFMHTCLRWCWLLSFWASACSPGISQSPPGVDSSLHVLAESDLVYGQATQVDVHAGNGSTYRLFITAPTMESPAQGFPVVYLSDANRNFASVAEIAKRQFRSGVVVVGIGYRGQEPEDYLEQRLFDLTTPASAYFVSQRLTILKNRRFGGAEQFLAFITQELQPWVEKRYSVNSEQQLLVGHSFGALFTLYAAMTRPSAFQGYLAVSPSLWWDGVGWSAYETVGFQQLAALDRKPHVVLAVGALENTWPKHVLQRDYDSADQGSMLALARNFSDRIAMSVPGIQVDFFVVPDANHGSVYVPALAQGLARLQQ